MKRREFLRTAGCACVALALPGPLLRALIAAERKGSPRTLLLLELQGGNDGLNAVIPFADPRYRELRPSLSLPPDAPLVPLDGEGGLGLHPALAPLLEPWKEKELAVVLGLGYPNPNHSHFRSIDIWDTGSDSDEYLQDGWASRALAKASFPEPPPAHGVVLGRGGEGPLAGAGTTTVVMDDPKRFFQAADRISEPPEVEGNAALQHLLSVQGELRKATQALKSRLKDAPVLKTPFPMGPLGGQLEFAARLLASGSGIPVIKASHKGFDTHSNQKGTHERLLKDLAEGLSAFRAACQEAGTWDRVLVMTYSEFGRRAAENGSGGTDHGTAAPQFVLGGKVAGGLFGKQPSLKEEDLDKGDLRFSTDFRSLYATVASDWWGLEPEGKHPPIAGLIRA